MADTELSGVVIGADRESVLSEARARAAQWFGTGQCIVISLTGPVVDLTEPPKNIPTLSGRPVRTHQPDPAFRAEYVARIQHRWEQRFTTYGPIMCGQCKVTSRA